MKIMTLDDYTDLLAEVFDFLQDAHKKENASTTCTKEPEKKIPVQKKENEELPNKVSKAVEKAEKFLRNEDKHISVFLNDTKFCILPQFKGYYLSNNCVDIPFECLKDKYGYPGVTEKDLLYVLAIRYAKSPEKLKLVKQLLYKEFED